MMMINLFFLIKIYIANQLDSSVNASQSKVQNCYEKKKKKHKKRLVADTK